MVSALMASFHPGPPSGATALRRLDTAGRAISFDALAREAQVSRSCLYAQPDLRVEVERLRSQQL